MLRRKAEERIVMLIFIIELLWFCLAASLIIEYRDYYPYLSTKDKCIVLLIFIIGAPAFGIVNFLTAILDTVFPDNWDNDE